MTDIVTLLAINFAALIAAILILWGIAVAIRDVSFIDAFWAWPGWGAAARARGLLPWAGAPA